MHYCDPCDKKYKTSRSLDTHKSRYHPYLKKVKYSDDKSQDIKPDEAWSVDDDMDQDSKIMKNDIAIELVKDDVSRLSKLVNDLEIKMMFPDQTSSGIELVNDELSRLRKLVNHLEMEMMFPDHIKQMGGSKLFDDNNYMEELKTVKNQSRNNKEKLSTIEKKLDDIIQSTQEKNSVAVEDLIYDMLEVKQLFMSHQFEELLSDIPKLRKVAKFLITAIEQFDMGELTDDDIKLLKEIGESSKATAKHLLKEKFNNIANIFTQLKTNELYEETKTNFDGESENSENDTDSCSEADNSDSGDSDGKATEIDNSDSGSSGENSENDKGSIETDNSDSGDSDVKTPEIDNSDSGSSDGKKKL